VGDSITSEHDNFYLASNYTYNFGLQESDSLTLTVAGRKNHLAGADGVRVFDDRNTFWSAEVPSYGVKVPHAGVTIKVLTQTGTSMKILVSR
jgi:immune inhibitor A